MSQIFSQLLALVVMVMRLFPRLLLISPLPPRPRGLETSGFPLQSAAEDRSHLIACPVSGVLF